MPATSLDRRAWSSSRTVPYGSIHDAGETIRGPAATRSTTTKRRRQLANLTGMSPEAASAFAAYHSGRFSHGSAFDDAA